MLGNLLLQGLMYVPNVDGLSPAIRADGFSWSPVYTVILLIQLVVMLGLLALTVRHYVRRKDWL